MSTFLHSNMDQMIWVHLPLGYEKPGLACLLKKGLYGLKQSPRLWAHKVRQKLAKYGYKPLQSDTSIYRHNKLKIYVITYVDDFLLIGPSQEGITNLKFQLQSEFEMKDLGECNYFLGIQIVRDRKNRQIHLSQSAYIDKVLATFQMEKAISKSTPMELGIKKSIADYNGIVTKTETTTYQSMIGSLMYAMTQSWPDLAYAVSFLSHFLQNPGPVHIKAAQRVLRYLKQTKNIGITYDGKQPGFYGYSDADYGEDIQTRKSRNGYVFYLYGGPISWKSARQKCVTLSSTESEYYGLSSAAREAAWLRLLTELKYQSGDIKPTIIKGDNQGSLLWPRTLSSIRGLSTLIFSIITSAGGCKRLYSP